MRQTPQPVPQGSASDVGGDSMSAYVSPADLSLTEIEARYDERIEQIRSRYGTGSSIEGSAISTYMSIVLAALRGGTTRVIAEPDAEPSSLDDLDLYLPIANGVTA